MIYLLKCVLALGVGLLALPLPELRYIGLVVLVFFGLALEALKVGE